jgi:uncharacterized membrane protein YeaQ/YmgE (transglycosylase-associated protein family)
MDFINSIISAPFICLGWIIVGVLAGSLARAFMKSSNAPVWNDLVLGILGAFVGGMLAGLLGIGTPEGGLSLVIANLIIATIGASILIGLRRTVFR